MENNSFALKSELTRTQICQIIYVSQGKSGEADKSERINGDIPRDNKETEDPSSSQQTNPKPSDSILPVRGDDPEEICIGDVDEVVTRESWDELQIKYRKESGAAGAEKIDVDNDGIKGLLTCG